MVKKISIDPSRQTGELIGGMRMKTVSIGRRSETGISNPPEGF